MAKKPYENSRLAKFCEALLLRLALEQNEGSTAAAAIYDEMR